jgi:hypothetical protein
MTQIISDMPFPKSLKSWPKIPSQPRSTPIGPPSQPTKNPPPSPQLQHVRPVGGEMIMRSINHRRPLGTRSVVLVPPLAVSCRLGRLPRDGARGREGPVGLWFGGLGSLSKWEDEEGIRGLRLRGLRGRRWRLSEVGSSSCVHCEGGMRGSREQGAHRWVMQ